MNSAIILKVAIPVPLYSTFDYLLPAGYPHKSIRPGQRLIAPFGRKHLCGVVMGTAKHSEIPAKKLRPIEAIVDETPIIPPDLLKLLIWAADYYRHPIGEVIHTALPRHLRQGKAIGIESVTTWRLTTAGAEASTEATKRAPRQTQLLNLLSQSGGDLDAGQLNESGFTWRPIMRILIEKGWVIEQQQNCLLAAVREPHPGPRLNDEQHHAVEEIVQSFGEFRAHLLQGVTGSGKTEVYLQLVRMTLERGEQALILVPEISLTPQLLRRFEQRLGVPIASLHSARNDSQRLSAWALASENKVPVVIGTRSAVFTPMPRLGLIIVDEEHDGSLKQQDGFRYHARDLAVMRAKQAGIPIVLGSATPSLESLYNVDRGLYQHLKLSQRAGASRPPTIRLLDMRNRLMDEGLSDTLLQQAHRHLEDGGQVLFFLNRRGYSPVLICHACGWMMECPRCDVRMTYHMGIRRLRCHHCDLERPVPGQCPDCGSEKLHPLGAGTERIEQALTRHFPDIGISRIDRDTIRRKGALAEKLKHVRSGQARILIGTQMLAKGHDFPDITLVGILDVDQGLFSTDFRAAEHTAQLLVQVAGRAGRAERRGEVLIQTHHPDHPLLQTLLSQGYEGFAKAALEERRQSHFPPFNSMAVLRAEAARKEVVFDFLRQAREQLETQPCHGVEIFGPLTPPMERRAGRYRGQLFLQADKRSNLQRVLSLWVPALPKLKAAAKARWSLDVDPQDTL